MKTGSTKVVRYAIYTRVSTDQGLEQDFNSLHAQYEASQAYIRSQAHALCVYDTCTLASSRGCLVIGTNLEASSQCRIQDGTQSIHLALKIPGGRQALPASKQVSAAIYCPESER
jgi:hypothetical protein